MKLNLCFIDLLRKYESQIEVNWYCTVLDEGLSLPTQIIETRELDRELLLKCCQCHSPMQIASTYSGIPPLFCHYLHKHNLIGSRFIIPVQFVTSMPYPPFVSAVYGSSLIEAGLR